MFRLNGSDDDVVLALRIDEDGDAVVAMNNVEVGYFSIRTGRFWPYCITGGQRNLLPKTFKYDSTGVLRSAEEDD